jgi:hypothetical protein
VLISLEMMLDLLLLLRRVRVEGSVLAVHRTIGVGVGLDGHDNSAGQIGKLFGSGGGLSHSKKPKILIDFVRIHRLHFGENHNSVWKKFHVF